jgi:hypothetical protein
MLKWLKQRGCVFTADTCAAAAGSLRTLSVLQYLHSQGVALEASTMVEAMKYDGILPVLQWLYEHGCPLSEAAALEAAKFANLDILSWLHSKDCPCDYQNLCFRALLRGDTFILQWAKATGVIDWSAALLQEYLKVAGVQGWLDTAQVCERFAADFFLIIF